MTKSQKVEKKEEIVSKGTPEIILYEKPDILKLRKIMLLPEISDLRKKQLYAYYKLNSEEGIPIKYYYSSKINKGRLYCDKNLGLQNFKRKVRNSISCDIYYDIDMENSGAVILEQYCNKNNIRCENLTKYVKDREEILKAISDKHKITREKAKKLMIKLFYLGKYTIDNNVSIKKLNFVQKFADEMEHIANKISDIEKEIYTICKNNDDGKNINSSVLSITYHTIENQCLLKMLEFFQSRNINVGTLCFDGLMLEKKSFDKLPAHILPIYIKECEEFVYEKTGYNLSLINKDMMKERLNHNLDSVKYNYYIEDELDCRERLFELVNPNYFKYCEGNLYVYDERTGMYVNGKEEKEAKVTLNYYLEKYNKNLKTIDGKSYGRSSRLKNNVLQTIKDGCVDNEWLNKTENTSIGYLLFNDGIYDMKNGKFKRGFDSDIVFHKRISNNFPKYDKDKIKEAYDISFGTLFDDPQIMINALSIALAGDTEIKKMYICPGKPNAGKSKLLMMLKIAFGGYVGIFDNGSLLVDSKMDSTDSAQKMRWALLSRFNRILFSSEAKYDEKKKLCGIKIKKHASGGDPIVGRFHQDNELSFTPHYTLFCLLNDVPEIEPLDVAVENRLEYIEFPYIFVDKDEINGNKNYKEGNRELNKKISTQDFIDGFIHIILDGYKDYLKNGLPKFNKEVKEAWIKENKQQKMIIDKIKQSFDITNDENDKVLVSDINNFRRKNCEISARLFTKMFEEELNLHQKITNKSRYWTGIKIKNDVNIDFLD